MKYEIIVAGVIGMTRHVHMMRVFLAVVVALILGAAAPAGWADDDDDDEDEIPFDVAEIFFELNNTDGDLGIHALIDGEAWKKLEIEDPREGRPRLPEKRASHARVSSSVDQLTLKDRCATCLHTEHESVPTLPNRNVRNIFRSGRLCRVAVPIN